MTMTDADFAVAVDHALMRAIENRLTGLVDVLMKEWRDPEAVDRFREGMKRTREVYAAAAKICREEQEP